MGFIKSNKGLIIGILVGVFVIGAVFLISTKTGLFDEDERLFKNIDENVDETGEVIVGDTPEEDADTTGLLDVPEEIESFVELPTEKGIQDGLNEDGTYNTLEAEVTSMWESNGLGVEDGDEGFVRDAKEELRLTSYEDYLKLKESGMNNVTEYEQLNLGMLGFYPKEGYVYKSNDVADLGGIKVVGANVGGDMVSMDFDIQNNSGEVLDMNEVQDNFSYRFVDDLGMGTDWKGVGGFSTEYNTIEEYNSGSVELDQYLGRNMTKSVILESINPETGEILAQALDTGGAIETDSDLILMGLGNLAYEEELGDKYQIVKDYQDALPSEIKLEVKYGEETADYVLVKSSEVVSYNYEEALK